jgi:glycine reductase
VIASKIEEAGIPVVQITAVVDVPKTVGVSRILRGDTISSPLGNPNLPKEEEDNGRMSLVIKAMDMLTKPGQVGVVETVELG